MLEQEKKNVVDTLVSVAAIPVEGNHGIFEGGDLGCQGAGLGGIKVNLTPSCNHKLVSQVPLDDISL